MSVVLPELIENAWTAVNVPLSKAIPDPNQYPALKIGNAPLEGGIINWSGGTLRKFTQEMIVHGGGHFASASNAVYAFDALNPRWRCLRPPSDVTGYDKVSPAYPDGKPVSRHTYCCVIDCPEAGGFWTYGGAKYPSGGGGPDTWMFNYETADWRRLADSPVNSHYYSAAAYDEQNKRVIAHIFIRLMAYYPAEDRWQVLSQDQSGNWHYPAAVIPPGSQKFFMIGGFGVYIYDLTQAKPVRQVKVPTGATEAIMTGYVSATWDCKRNRILLWNKPPYIYAMDPETFHIKPLATRGTAPELPRAYTGTYGRFQYVEPLDAVVMMLDPYGPVYYLRLTDEGVVAVPPPVEEPQPEPEPEQEPEGGPTETPEPTEPEPQPQPETEPTTPTEQQPPPQPPVILAGDGPMIRLESTGNVYSSLTQAEVAARPGDTITLAPWVYLRGITAITKPLTIRSPGPRRAVLDAQGLYIDGKGILVHRQGAGDLTLERLEVVGAKVPDTNGAGLRVQGEGTIEVRDCYFHGNENGILASNFNTTVFVYDCIFERNGHVSGQSHNLYVNVKSFVIRRSVSRDSYVGHLLKSRSQETIITDCWLYDQRGQTSIAVDISTGGLLQMCRSVIRKGKPGENKHLMKYAAEGLANDGRVHRMEIVDCLLLDDIGGFLINAIPETVEVAGNQWDGRRLLPFPWIVVLPPVVESAPAPVPAEETEDQKRNAEVFEHLRALAGLLREPAE